MQRGFAHKNFCKTQRKTSVSDLFFNKKSRFVQKELQHKCFPRNFIKFVRAVILGTIHIWHPWKLSNIQDPPPFCPATSEILPPLDLGGLISNITPLPLKMMTNQSKRRSAVSFRFQYQLINLAWFSVDFFSFSWSQSLPKSNSKKFKFSFSPSSYSEKTHWVQGWPKASLSTF